MEIRELAPEALRDLGYGDLSTEALELLSRSARLTVVLRVGYRLLPNPTGQFAEQIEAAMIEEDDDQARSLMAQHTPNSIPTAAEEIRAVVRLLERVARSQ